MRFSVHAEIDSFNLTATLKPRILGFTLPVNILSIKFHNLKSSVYFFDRLIRRKKSSSLSVKAVLSELELKSYQLSVIIGTENAACTALLAGGLLALFGKNLKITPVFDKNTFHLDFKCIIIAKFVKIIYTVIKSRRKKHGKTSDRKYNDNNTGTVGKND